MSALASLPSPKKPGSPKTNPPRKTYRHEAFHDAPSSAPSSPSRRARTPKVNPLEASRSQRPNHGTFLEDSTPIENDHGCNEDGEDPHDLSFSARHEARASMVDNMVMSLDQFSNAGLESSPYSSNNTTYEPGAERRARGHTFSSSFSSDGDIREVKVLQSVSPPAIRLPRRGSLKYQKNLQKLPSIFGEDEDSVRVKVYDAQRAEIPVKGRPRKKNRIGGKGSASSTSSSIDLGHLAKFQGRLGPAGNRRSRSFDFGSSNRPVRTFDLDPPEVGPRPVALSGQETQGTPTAANFPGPTLVRKNSTKSSKSMHGRKGRAGTLGTATIKSKAHEPPPMPAFKNSSAQVGFDSRTGTTSPQEAVLAAKPGFFRRVFGSSKTALAQSDTSVNTHSPSTRPSQDRTYVPENDLHNPSTPTTKLQKPLRRISTEASANKENVPVVAKKPSTFFRRRKKSTSNVPAPPSLTLGSERKLDSDRNGLPSPVSSLRAFMDPYLAGNPAPASGHPRPGSNQGFYTPPAMPSASFGDFTDQSGRPGSGAHGRNDSHGSSRMHHQAKQVSSLRIPHHDSFLADSSSTEEQPRKSPLEPSPMSDVSKKDSRPHHLDGGLKPSSATSLTNPSSASSGRRPQIPDRSKSWNSERDRKSISNSEALYSSLSSHTHPVQSVVHEGSKGSLTTDTVRKGSRGSPRASASDVSDYRSAPSTPLVLELPDNPIRDSPIVHVSHPSMSMGDIDADKRKARKIFDNADEELDYAIAGAWLGDAGTERERIRSAFMELFDFTHLNILASLRALCDRIVLKGETQQVDRMLDAFAQRWCTCNCTHGFRSNDVVHTICYSILLLNTDLHLADIGQKMTKTQFTRNALPTIKRVAEDSKPSESSKGQSLKARSPTFPNDDTFGRPSTEHDNVAILRGPKRPVEKMNREDSGDLEAFSATGGPLIESSHQGTERGWEAQVEAVLKAFYTSISQEPLPLFGSQPEPTQATSQNNNLLTLGGNMLRRTPSTLSKAHSDTNRGRFGADAKSLGARWASKARSRPRLPSAAGFGSSRTSLDDQSSAWSPSMSSTWSKTSIGKTLTSMSVDSFGTEATHGDYQASIGFANALSQAIIRDDQFDVPIEDGMKAAPLLEDESLELCGAPWAKEGILKHKCHLEGVDKRSKDRNWNDCFAVIEKGWMRLFSFSMTAKSLRSRARNQKAGGVVGGGNWQDNAEEVWKFMLRHAIASALPPPGYSKTRPFVWALSLPTGAVHLFSVGTPDIVKEFVCTANFWSARLSKEPMMGGVSNMEYGWSDLIINRALLPPEGQSAYSLQAAINSTASPRPSTQMSMRSSFDHGGNSVKPKLPGDRAYINEWNPPQQSMFPSQLMECDQLKALQTYVKNVEEELQKHNELRAPMLLAFSSKLPNSSKAMNNWEKKSSYLLREIVKFRTYIDTLQTAQGTKERIYRMRKEEDASRQAEDDSRV